MNSKDRACGGQRTQSDFFLPHIPPTDLKQGFSLNTKLAALVRLAEYPVSKFLVYLFPAPSAGVTGSYIWLSDLGFGVLMHVLILVTIAVKKHHNQGNSWKGKHLIGGLLRVAWSIIIMSRSMAAGWRNSRELCILLIRQGVCVGEDRSTERRKDKNRDWAWPHTCSKKAMPTPTTACLLVLHGQLLNWALSIQIYELMGANLIQTTTAYNETSDISCFTVECQVCSYGYEYNGK